MLQPLPPEPIPTTPPEVPIHLEPIPMPDTPNWTHKPVLKSRTIWTIIGTIAGFILAKVFGLDGIDVGGAIGEDGVLQLGELVLLLGTILAAWFRKQATGPLGPPPQG